MSMAHFQLLFPELAIAETRSATVRKPMFEGGQMVLPADDYAFCEAYCVEADCDCRCVLFSVLARDAKAVVATIQHAFELPPTDAHFPMQTYLDPQLKQSRWAQALLGILRDVMLADGDYRERLIRHNRLVKDAVADPAHPCQEILRNLGPAPYATAARRSPIPPPPRRGKRRKR